MKTSQAGIDAIKEYEGFAPMPYRCPSGYTTIGYGHVVGRNESYSLPIDRQTAEALLRKDIEEAEMAVNTMVTVPLSQHEFDALVSFVFNVGASKFQNSTLLKLLLAGRRKEAADQFLRWVHASDRQVLPGLLVRRRAERRMFLGCR